jgi:transposase
VSLARLVITAVVLEGRRPIDVATEYGVSKGWVSKLVARYHAEGDSAFEPRSRRPHTSPSATPSAVVALIIATRHDLTRQGLDAGNATIAWHLDHHHQVTVSESTIHRYLVAAGLVTPEPRKKPRASYIRFQAELPNECWQADFTHYYLSTRDDMAEREGFEPPDP